MPCVSCGGVAEWCELCDGPDQREIAARVCDARALSLAENGQIVAAVEAQKCAAAIRRRAA
jgi:Fe-S-cluster-containing hydrogenase component 2